MTTESDGLLTYGKRQSFFILFCISRLFQFPFLRRQNFCPDNLDRFLPHAISCKRICITRAKITSRDTSVESPIDLKQPSKLTSSSTTKNAGNIKSPQAFCKSVSVFMPGGPA